MFIYYLDMVYSALRSKYYPVSKGTINSSKKNYFVLEDIRVMSMYWRSLIYKC